MNKSNSTRVKKNKKEDPLEPEFLIPIKEDRNNCYDNISVNIDRGMPGHPLEKEIKQQESRELREQAEDEENYEIYLNAGSSSVRKEGPLEPEFLIPIKEDRNNCYDNISANIDRGMPGHPLEKEIKRQESRELREQAEDEEDYELLLQSSTYSVRRQGPPEPTYSVTIKENRNNCYDNIAAAIDRGMPGHPLEREIERQEERELRERAYDQEDYEDELQGGSSNRRKEGPLEPRFLVPIKENHNNCYDNICAVIDRGMPGHPLEREIERQEERELRERAYDQEDYEDELQGGSSNRRKKSPLGPRFLVSIKENRNNCYDNICAVIDRGMPGHPLEKEIKEQEERESREHEEDKLRRTNPSLFEQAPPKSSSNNKDNDNKGGAQAKPDDGVFMTLEVSDDDDDDKPKRVRPPSNRPKRPRVQKQFFSTYDPKIFYPSTNPRRGAPPRIIHNKLKHPVKLKVTLKDIGLDGMDSPIPGKAAEMFLKEKMKQKPEKSITIPNQTNFSQSLNRVQYQSAAAAAAQNQEFSASFSNVKRSKMLDDSSDDSYEEHNFDLNEIDESSSSSSSPSPPPSPQKDMDEIKINRAGDRPFALKVTEPTKRKNEDGNRSPRRKKPETPKSTYDPSIFYTPYNTSSSNETGSRVRYVNDLIRKPIKLTVTLKEIGLEGLDSPVSVKKQSNPDSKSKKH